ncbi:hypothetical protein F4553_003759 [Allocatelliglobosispora scoriae]|uniref:Uncharacterized protein n=1 Tax=Allocatelliglobosispora scoriae TaxID=643052 RepID=A0A841BUE5_9ACTN|nr:hypothetical protein [Allocatelliglobosispora scoriae]MBB5870380.1 hypothetical protein [Allocatelliglobosispora scoriae]
MSTETITEIESYAAAVRTALADLPEQTRNELLEDLTDHLTEVAAEQDGGTLLERLGPPAHYAAELRATLPAGGVSPSQQRWSLALTRGRVRAQHLDARLGRVLGYPRFSDYARLLRPAWWIIRGWAAAMIFCRIASVDARDGLLPVLEGNEFVGLLVLIGAVVGSIWLGRRAGGFGTWPKRLVAVGSAVVALGAVIGFFELDSDLRHGPSVVYQTSGSPLESVEDLYVYDAGGKLLTGVRVFDQWGNQITVGFDRCGRPATYLGDSRSDVQVTVYEEPGSRTYPFCPEMAPLVQPMPSAPVQVDPTPYPSKESRPKPTADPAPAPSPTVR